MARTGEAASPIDALVVGAGPVGLLVAIELAARGCRVRIVDALDKIEQKTKASGISARSLEVLPKPVTDNIVKHGNLLQKMRLNETDLKGNGQVIATIPIDSIPIYHGMRTQAQWQTEEMLQWHLETLPDLHRGANRTMRVERQMEFLKITENAVGSVKCQVRNNATGVVETITAKFLIGADGGRSSIRKCAGFSFEGEVTNEYFFALHAALDNYVGDFEAMDTFFSRGDDPDAPGFAFTMPMPDGGFLITCDLDLDQQEKWVTGELDRNGLPILKQPEAKDIIGILRQRGCGTNLTLREGSVKWVSHFRVQSRLANFYRQGQVFIAGDACHCHSPLGGQGMNMGFLDAKNLAWKVATAVKNPGSVVEKLLDTYEAERKSIDKKLLGAIEKAQSGVSSRSAVVFFLRGRGQRLIGSIASMVGNAAGQVISQQAWAYSPSLLSQEHWERPPPTCIPITTLCPFGGYRRRQNFFRWAARRTRCGDRAPAEAKTDSGELLEQVMKRSRGWTLLLFEGLEDDNEDQEAHIRNVEIMDVDGLRQLGNSMKANPDATGYVNGVDEVVVFSAAGPGDAHDMFGVKGQCMYLIRPDMHVGLRCEPVREGAAYRYFKQTCGMSGQPAVSCPPPAATLDLLPTIIWAIIFLILVVSLILVEIVDEEHPNKLPFRVALGCVSVVVLMLATLQFLGSKWAASAIPPDVDEDEEDEEDEEDKEEDEPDAKRGLLSKSCSAVTKVDSNV